MPTFFGRVARVTHVQPVPTTHHRVVAHIMQVLVVRLSRLDVDIFEGDIPTWLGFGAVHPYDTVGGGRSSNVFKVDIVPLEQTRVFAFIDVVEQVCEAAISTDSSPSLL